MSFPPSLGSCVNFGTRDLLSKICDLEIEMLLCYLSKLKGFPLKSFERCPLNKISLNKSLQKLQALISKFLDKVMLVVKHLKGLHS